MPDRTTLIKVRQRWGLETFQRAFEQILVQCRQAGLIKGNTLVVDGTQIRARAATTSLEQQVLAYLQAWPVTTDAAQSVDRDDEQGPPPPTDGHRQRQAGDPDFHGETFSNATHRSRTDPEARLSRKGVKQEAYLRYLGHYVLDKDTGVILSAAASQVYGNAETKVAQALLTELRQLPHFSKRPRVLMDRGYRDSEFLAALL